MRICGTIDTYYYTTTLDGVLVAKYPTVTFAEHCEFVVQDVNRSCKTKACSDLLVILKEKRTTNMILFK